MICRLILAVCCLLFCSPLYAGDLSIVLAGPAVVNNYPPANVISVRGTAHPAGGNVAWGLNGAEALSTILQSVTVPAGQKVWFGSAALPAGFPPGVYTLFARDGTEEVRGVSVVLPGSRQTIPADVIRRIRAAALGLAPLPGLSSVEAVRWLEEHWLSGD